MEDKAAFIMSQSALLNAHIAMYQAENQVRADQRLAPIYGEEQFYRLIHNEFSCLLHNNVLNYLRI
jgi:hypothetical protein